MLVLISQANSEDTGRTTQIRLCDNPVGNPRPISAASEMSFKWHFAGGPIMARDDLLAGKYHNHMRASPNTNKRVIGSWVAHPRMVVYKVMDRHYRYQYSII